MQIYFTDAPLAYDYDHTIRNMEVSGYVVPYHSTLHAVRIPEDFVEYQIARYRSGFYVCLDEKELQTWFSYNLARRTLDN